MKSTYFFSLLFLLAFCCIISAVPNETSGQLAKPGCSDRCGNIRIPYPFGIGPNCAINQSYSISCTSSKPYLTQLNLQVLNVSLLNRTITLSVPINNSCSSRPQPGSVARWDSSNLAGTPFFYSKTYNRMMVFGCGNAVLIGLMAGENVLTGCTSACEFHSSGVVSSCNGVDCCEATIPYFLTDYEINFTLSRFNSRNCSSAFLADQNWSPSGNLGSELSWEDVPVVLAWTLGSEDVQAIYRCSSEMTYLDTGPGQRVATYMCPTCEYGSTDPESVNPYLQDQCGAVRTQEQKTNNTRAALTGVFTSIGCLLLVAIAFTLYKLVKQKREKMIKHKNFKRNGGLLLQQQLSSSDGMIEKTRIFGIRELEKATDGFNPNMIVGQGGQGTVYKGMLTDGRLVAIKKSKKVDQSQLETFINEVVILSQINHRNVVKLLGCCLETEVPMLVYELIPNGTLFSLIHNNQNDDDGFPFFTWNLRLRIATEVAGALAYLHSATSMPIFHRDIKSRNILLDEKYIAKVGDFGTSKTVGIDRTHLTTQVKGTFGYLDPEYFQSSQFTEKSDVYSFGVVLVELLTRMDPIYSARAEEDSHLNLAARFLMCIDSERLFSLLDPEILHDEGNEEQVVAAAKLAQRCLNLDGKKRPTMKELAIELERIKMWAAARSKVEENLPSEVLIKDGRSESVVFSPESNITETVSTRVDSGAYPLLHDTI